MFSSFIQAGFECSSHKLITGRRLDLIASTRHDVFVRQDYQRLKDAGVLTAREGLRWHLIEASPGKYEFSSLLPMIEAANRAGIQVIWDIFHFGWPDHLNIFDDSWTKSLADLAFEFSVLWKRESGTRAFVAPLNEISFFSWAGGDRGFFNPFAQQRGPELKTRLVTAGLRACEAIRSELPDAVIVSPEPVIHIHGNPAIPNDVQQAEEHRLSMFEAWDMMQGKAKPELGGKDSTLNVLGVNFYDRNQWWNFGNTIFPGDPAYRPFHLILEEVYQRYGLPMFISETGTENEARPGWFAYIATEVRTAISRGVPVFGICLYPILNHPGWDDNRHCHNGLWDYATPDGERAVYEPLLMEIQMQEALRTMNVTGKPTK